MLIKFETANQHAEFKDYMERNRIAVWLWSDEWRTDKPNSNVVVVDKKYERKAFEFINNCKN